MIARQSALSRSGRAGAAGSRLQDARTDPPSRRAPVEGPAGLILVGKFGAPQGLRGEIRIRSYTQDPLAIAGYGPLFDAAGARAFRIERARIVRDDVLVAAVEGVSNRTDAQALTNIDLYVRRAQLPATTDEDEFYVADLVGLEARLPDGSPFGVIAAIDNFGAGDILQIRRPDGAEALIAFTRQGAPLVNIEEGYVVVDPPEEAQAEPDPDTTVS